MVGLNPYTLHSFRELRAVMGRPYVVCRACRRFVPVGLWLDSRDTRTTTFSCSVCGGDGDVVFEDPAKEGLQHDPRANPPRHEYAALRLQHLQRLANPFGHRAPPRESMPARERPRREPPPKYKLMPLPFATLGDVPRLGLVLTVWCSTCKSTRSIDIDARLAAPRWGRVRFRCTDVRYDGSTCGGFGHPTLRPAAPIDADRAFVTLTCGRCLPPWEAQNVQLDRPPWSGAPIDARNERCPACSGQVSATFHDMTGRRLRQATYL